MLVKGLIDEDFVNYKKPSMYIALGHCNWKCCTEANIPTSICQNSELANAKEIEVSVEELFRRYSQNPITKAIVFGGLEPMTMSGKIIDFVDYFRKNKCTDDIVIYTGYYKQEIPYIIRLLKRYQNIVIKFGRFKPDSEKRFDDILGVTLISDNQYAERIS